MVWHNNRPIPEGDGGVGNLKLSRALSGPAELRYESSEGIDNHNPHDVTEVPVRHR